MMSGACFPDNAKHRTIAKITEGGFIIGGIAMLAVVNTGADCKPDVAGMRDVECEDRAKLVGSIGLAMILAGLIGFITTVSTSPDDKPDAPTTAPEPPAPPEPMQPMQSPANPPSETPPTEPTPPAPETPTTPAEPTPPTP